MADKLPDQLALRERQELDQKSQNEAEEFKAYQEWKLTGKLPIPLEVALKMYELYLNYYEINEIYRINGGKFPLGQIVDAKLRYEWDKMREKQISIMHSNITDRVIKTKNDSIVQVSDFIAAFHKRWGDKLRQYLQTGDEQLVEDLGLNNLKNYKELVSMLQTLTSETGKKADKKVKVEGTVTHVHEKSVKGEITGKSSFDLLNEIDGKVENE